MVAIFTYQGKGDGDQSESRAVTRSASVEECSVAQLVQWSDEVQSVGVQDPKIVRVEIGDPNRGAQQRFDNLWDFLDWRRRAPARG
jgi:hypothetical protein